MASDVQIANLALDSIGARATIASLTEQSSEALVIARQYEQAREDVLCAAHWNFARRQVALTLLKDATLSTPDSVPQPWLYSYAYPSDCVGARYILPLFTDTAGTTIFGPDFGYGAAAISQAPMARFIVSSDLDDDGNTVKVILTNQPQAQLVYTTRITDPRLFDGPFVRAFANYLGALVCLAMNGDKAMARGAFQMADATTKEARKNNDNEGPTVIDTLPDWLQARGIAPGGSDGVFVQNPVDLTFIA